MRKNPRLLKLCSIWLNIFVSSIIATALPSYSRERGLVDATDLIASEIIKYLKRNYDRFNYPQIMFGIKKTKIYGGCEDDQGTKNPHIWGSFFCGTTNTIILEPEQLEELRNKHGDGAIAYVIAHEVGHWIQNHASASPLIETLKPARELQADCLAGHLMMQISGQVGIDESDLVEALRTAYTLGGSMTHGTKRQRLYALNQGFKGVEQCWKGVLLNNKDDDTRNKFTLPSMQDTNLRPLPKVEQKTRESKTENKKESKKERCTPPTSIHCLRNADAVRRQENNGALPPQSKDKGKTKERCTPPTSIHCLRNAD